MTKKEKVKVKMHMAFVHHAKMNLKQLKELVEKPLKSPKMTKRLILNFIRWIEYDLEQAEIKFNPIKSKPVRIRCKECAKEKGYCWARMPDNLIHQQHSVTNMSICGTWRMGP